MSASAPGSCGPTSSFIAAAGGPYASMVAAALCGMADIDPCALVNQADVQALFTEPIGTYTTDHLGNCNWPVADTSKSASIDIRVETGPDATTSLETIMGPFANNTPLPGVGDQAMWQIDGITPVIGAVKGQVNCQVGGNGDNTSFAVAVNGKPPFDEIDAAALPGLMARFGTLCNEIFANLGALSSLPAPTEAPATAAAGNGSDICSLLPAAQVAQITGEPIDGSTPRTSSLIPNDVGCTYAEGALASAVLIDVVNPGGAADYDAAVSNYSNANPVTGFGDKAFRDDGDGLGFVALFGDTEFTVFILDEDGKVGDVNVASEQLITALRSKL